MSKFTELTEAFDKSLDSLKEKLSSIRTGRAIPSLVEKIPVDAYGAQAELKTLASISAPEPRQLLIQPFDPGVLQAIEQAITKSNLDLSPIVEGDHIRISMPPLTEEKRQLLVKEVGKQAEETRVALRKIREDTLKDLKASQSSGEITEDDLFNAQREIQELIDDYNQRIEKVVASKEQEVMSV